MMEIGIAGAGASGMMAAIAAVQSGAKVTILEKNNRVGKKLLATGNGKCNVSNLDFGMDKYYCRDKEKLKRLFQCFSVEDTITFFEENGLLLRSRDGYLYPYSEQASTVLDIFRRMLTERKIETVTETEIREASYDKVTKKFTLKSGNRTFSFDRLILSCGGPAGLRKDEGMGGFDLVHSFGHRIWPVVPGLVQLRAKESFLKLMAGVRAKAEAVLLLDGKESGREQGEIQFTDYGISGIPVFQVSRMAAYGLKEGKEAVVSINFFPDYQEKEFEDMIANRYQRMRDTSLEEFLLGTCNKKINQAMIKRAGLSPSDKVEKLGLQRIIGLLKEYQGLNIRIDQVNSMENAQVCAGGVDLSEVDDSLQSLKCPGLYLTGELLDVDGKCGGYNLQWAWTSGYIAGRNAGCLE